MRTLLQKVSKASVSIGGKTIARIDSGLAILLGVAKDDSDEDARWLAAKCAGLRIFEDENGKMNLSLLDIGGKALVVSQFTLYGDTRKGRRPSYTDAAPPDIAIPLYELFVEELRKLGVKVETGEFGAMMEVEIHNSGPVTLIVDSQKSVRIH